MKTIVVLTDFTKTSQHAAEFALEVAGEINAEIILYHSFHIPHLVPEEVTISPFTENYSLIETENVIKLERLIDELQKKYVAKKDKQAPKITFKSDLGDLLDNVNKLSREKQIWMMVMGEKSKKRPISRLLTGNSTFEIINDAVCPVLLIPEEADLKPVKTIAFATALLDSERNAVSFLKNIAAIWSSNIVGIHICDEKLTAEEKADHYQKYKEIISETDEPVQYTDFINLEGDIAGSLEEFSAKNSIDLLAIQHTKPFLFSDWFHKSIAKEIIDFHKIPLLILPSIETDLKKFSITLQNTVF
jgi:nucleotide-binding universal stress UspA family protein